MCLGLNEESLVSREADFDLPAAAAYLIEEAKSGAETQGAEGSESRSTPPFQIFNSVASL